MNIGDIVRSRSGLRGRIVKYLGAGMVEVQPLDGGLSIGYMLDHLELVAKAIPEEPCTPDCGDCVNVGECLSERTGAFGGGPHLEAGTGVDRLEDQGFPKLTAAMDEEKVTTGIEAFRTALQKSGFEMSVPVVRIDDAGPKIRVTSAKSGGQKERNLFRYGLIPWEMLRGLARHYGLGAFKYDDNNWRKGYDWSLSYDALLRHLEAWRSGESVTVEQFEKDGKKYAFETHHLIAVIWQATTLYCFERWGIGKDDVTKKTGLANQERSE